MLNQPPDPVTDALKSDAPVAVSISRPVAPCVSSAREPSSVRSTAPPQTGNAQACSGAPAPSNMNSVLDGAPPGCGRYTAARAPSRDTLTGRGEPHVVNAPGNGRLHSSDTDA